VAIPNVTLPISTAQPLDPAQIIHEVNAVALECSLYLSVIQQPVRKWEKPWLHQRVVILFANSAEQTKLRLQLEGRVRPGEQVLQIVRVGE
jgi:hypothetical protein